VFKNLIKIFQAFAGSKTLLAQSIVAIFVVSFCLLSIGGEIKSLIDGGINGRDPKLLNLSAIKIIALLCAFSLFGLIRASAVSKLSNKIIHDLRSKAYANLLTLPVAYYAKNSAAKLQLSIVDCAQSISVIAQEIFSFLIRNTIVFISAIILMYRQSHLLFALVLGVVVFALLPIIFFIKRSRNLSQNKQQLTKDMSELIVEVIDNIKIIYGYNLQSSSIAKFHKLSEDLTLASNDSSINRSIFFSVIVALVSISVTVIIWAGASQILDEKITSGSLVAFIIYAVMSVSSLIGILNNASEIQPQFEKLEHLFEMCGDPQVRSFKTSVLVGDLDIKFDAVNFSYNDALPVLHNFSYEIKYGEFVTIYGKSGVGKSTLVYLLLKFYSPHSGSIKIAGQDIADIDDSVIRKNIVFINQDPLIFSTSVLENITLGKAYLERDLQRVIDICQLNQVLRDMPDGINTFVGQKGVKISGGQKQRICIARSLLMSPHVLVLDEATNALDPESESKILSGIKEFMRGKTVIFISHNHKIMEFADKAINLDSTLSLLL